jgi:hypothetical protein
MQSRHRRGWIVTAVVVLVVLLSGASVQTHGATGPSTLGTGGLRPVYHGQYITPRDVATLQAQGLATSSEVNRELVCQGVELYFDSNAQRAAYLADYAKRFPTEPPYLAGNPCSPFRNSPSYAAGQ